MRCHGEKAVAFAGFLAIALGCPELTSAFTVISEAKEAELGRQADQEILKRFGRYPDPELEAYVTSVGERLLQVVEPRGIKYQFKVVDSPEVNAFALPGGYIYVNRGMLAELNSEAELAGVLGHEIGHVAGRHAARQMTRSLGYQVLTLGLIGLGAAAGAKEHVGQLGMVMGQLFQMILLGYSRDFELEADDFGLRVASKAGYDPQVIIGFHKRLRLKERLEGSGYHGFSTHPDTAERIVKAETLAHLLAAEGGGAIVGADTYKAHLEGLLYGEKGQQKRLRVYTAKGGENLPQVALELFNNENRAWELARFNGLKENAVLKTGEKLKIMPD